jgi:hypothetical protein
MRINNYPIKKKLIPYLILVFLFAPMLSWAVKLTIGIVPDLVSTCSGKNALTVISLNKIPLLQGKLVTQLILFNNLNNKFQAITFQVDQKDTEQRYIIDTDNPSIAIGHYDELVIRQSDLGQRINHLVDISKDYQLIEIEVLTYPKQASRWFYIKLFTQTYMKQAINQTASIFYNTEDDRITSAIYKTVFAKQKPFLIDAFHWYLPEQSAWSPNISDMMKIRHKGEFLSLEFERTQDDYQSRLTAIKEGPLRIIRRTENKVKILWQLKTPALYIDYVMMPNGFVMDTMLDIPFKIAYFFNSLETLTTMDWNQTIGQQRLTVRLPESNLYYLITGQASVAQQAFNNKRAEQFSVVSDWGIFNVSMSLPKNFPVQSFIFLKDDLKTSDPPENYPGQFGNVGFRTTGWEKIDSQLHHLKFKVCLGEPLKIY